MKHTAILIGTIAALTFPMGIVRAQTIKPANVPEAVQSALAKKYPTAAGVSWEKEKGNYEANWGGKSREDNSVVFMPDGTFVEIVVAIPVITLPEKVKNYVAQHYPGKKITEAGKVTDAHGNLSYEAEIGGKDLIFGKDGTFVKKD